MKMTKIFLFISMLLLIITAIIFSSNFASTEVAHSSAISSIEVATASAQEVSVSDCIECIAVHDNIILLNSLVCTKFDNSDIILEKTFVTAKEVRSALMPYKSTVSGGNAFI